MSADARNIWGLCVTLAETSPNELLSARSARHLQVLCRCFALVGYFLVFDDLSFI
jgi:hypothetical protein